MHIQKWSVYRTLWFGQKATATIKCYIMFIKACMDLYAYTTLIRKEFFLKISDFDWSVFAWENQS